MEEKQEAKATEKVEKKDVKTAEKKEEKKVTDKKETKKETKKESKPKDTKKKFKITKGENKKIDNKMIMGIAVAVIILVAILVCVLTMGNSPKKSVEAMLHDLKSGNYNQTALAGILKGENFDEDTQKLFFDKLDWKIQNVKTEGDKATVEVEITNKDFKTILNNYMQKIFKLAFGGQNTSQEEMTNYLKEELNNDQIQTVTSNQSILLEKKDGKWEVTEENDFVNILLPGFSEAINAFN